jgi:hypothetical protein
MEFKTKEQALDYFKDINLLKPAGVLSALEEIQYNLTYSYYLGVIAGINLVSDFNLIVNDNGKITTN